MVEATVREKFIECDKKIINEVSVRRISGGMLCLSERGPRRKRAPCVRLSLYSAHGTNNISGKSWKGRSNIITLQYSTCQVKFTITVEEDL
jgi:hypothetical protein